MVKRAHELRRVISMRDFLSSPAYLGGPEHFGNASWDAWKIVLIAAMGEELTEDERVKFHELTGREIEPGAVVRELWACVGRRGGKSLAIAALATYFACCCDHRHVLAKGQVGLVPVISASKQAALEIRNYAVGIIESVPAFAKLMEEATVETIRLSTRITIRVQAANFKRIRGGTAVAIVGDEICYWSNDDGSANPDAEIIAAARPMLMTTSGMLAIISSPYAKRGIMFKTVSRHHGPDGDPGILVVRGSSRDMNPTISQAEVDAAYAEDPIAAAAEWGGEFRAGLDAYVSEEVVGPLVLRGVHEIPHNAGMRCIAFVDAASGSGRDSMTYAIAYMDERNATLALIAERRPPFNPEAAVAECAEVLKRYRISRVIGDNWAAGFVQASFERHGISYQKSDKTKSDIYREAIPMMNSGQCRLLDNRRLEAQLLGLERSTSKTGKDTIDHAPNGHDDLANACCGALVNVSARQPMRISNECLARFSQPMGERAAAQSHAAQYRRYGIPGW